jgi:hypothetical protein
MTNQDRALAIWQEANLMQRISYMNMVPYDRSITKRFRAIIAYLATEVEAGRITLVGELQSEAL